MCINKERYVEDPLANGRMYLILRQPVACEQLREFAIALVHTIEQAFKGSYPFLKDFRRKRLTAVPPTHHLVEQNANQHANDSNKTGP